MKRTSVPNSIKSRTNKTLSRNKSPRKRSEAAASAQLAAPYDDPVDRTYRSRSRISGKRSEGLHPADNGTRVAVDDLISKIIGGALSAANKSHGRLDGLRVNCAMMFAGKCLVQLASDTIRAQGAHPKLIQSLEQAATNFAGEQIGEALKGAKVGS